MEAVNHTLFVYHCLDHSTREEEARLIRRADAVFCVSQALVEKHSVLNPQTFLLPNGTDLTIFDINRATQAPRPAELPTGTRLIGYAGSIDCHLDIELLVQIARAFPGDTVILLGKVWGHDRGPSGSQAEALRVLLALPNVRFLGFRRAEDLEPYLQAFDVCLVPLLREPFNRERDPAKFYQYIALAKPIVTTPVPVAERYRDICYVADSHDDFIAQTSRALCEGSSEILRQARLAVARAHSWESLVAQACKIIEENLAALSAPLV
jgi:glycosyltransferase involved in cell wall biosynthesis